MKPKILLYEDDQSILDVLQMILEDEGYEVHTATHCDTLDEIRSQSPALVIIDLWIPELGGEEVCRQVKADQQLKHIPVMFISASNQTEEIAKKVHADAFIHKPFDIQEVKRKARELTQK